MKLEIENYDSLCELRVFKVNDIEADYEDFGEKYDNDPDNAEEYGCGNMIFEAKPATQEVLDKYQITLDEYNKICSELDVLGYGSCGWCI